MNKKNNLEFLDSFKTPTDEMVYNAFNISLDEAKIYNSKIPPNIISGLKETPDNVTKIEGSVWTIYKNIWNTKLGPYTKMEAIKNNMSANESKILLDVIEDIEFEEIDYDFNSYFEYELGEAVSNENYHRAAYLRDWMKDYKILIKKLKPLMVNAILEENFNKLSVYIEDIKKYHRTL